MTIYRVAWRERIGVYVGVVRFSEHHADFDTASMARAQVARLEWREEVQG